MKVWGPVIPGNYNTWRGYNYRYEISLLVVAKTNREAFDILIKNKNVIYDYYDKFKHKEKRLIAKPACDNLFLDKAQIKIYDTKKSYNRRALFPNGEIKRIKNLENNILTNKQGTLRKTTKRK